MALESNMFVYTVDHKNRVALFSIISLAFLGWFFILFVLWKQEWMLCRGVNKIYHFTLTVSPQYLVKIENDIKTAHFEVNHHNAFDWTGCSQLSQEIVQCSSFQILGRKFFYQSSSRKSFTLRKVFDQNFIFETYLIVKSNSMK